MKIKFLEKVPPLNLWNWPSQPNINFHKHVIEGEKAWLKQLAVDEKRTLSRIEYHEQQIKSKTWLYYLRTGSIVE